MPKRLKPRPKGVLTAIAARELRAMDSDKIVEVRLGRPTRAGRKDWICGFQIIGLNDDRIRRAAGADALQALVLALKGIRHTLENCGHSLTWIGGEHGDHGVPRAIPTFFGRQFATKIGKVLDQEIKKFGRAT
jgi:hypothetical protein